MAAKRNRVASLGLMLPYLRPYLWRVAGASVALLLAAGLMLGLGQGVRLLIDQGFGAQSLGRLNEAAAIMFATVATLAVATFCRFYLVSWLGERVAGDLRRDVFNKVLTLANGDRILMTAAMKAFFEPDNLANASPATVSRAGIIYVSDTELGWEPVMKSWLQRREPSEAAILQPLFDKCVGGHTLPP